MSIFFFFNDTATTEIYTLSLHDALPIRAAGGSAHWHQVDLTEAEQVSAAVANALTESGRVDVVVHAAGVEISHFLPDKPQPEYDLVFDVKAEGWLNLLHALGDRAPDAVVGFSSIAGRFGNA